MADTESERSYECIHCGGPVEAGFTTSESYERDGAIAVVKEIPCEKCRQCGATFLSDDVFAVVERQTEAAFESGSELTVIRYGSAGAAADASRSVRSLERLQGAAVTRSVSAPEIESEQRSISDE